MLVSQHVCYGLVAGKPPGSSGRCFGFDGPGLCTDDARQMSLMAATMLVPEKCITVSYSGDSGALGAGRRSVPRTSCDRVVYLCGQGSSVSNPCPQAIVSEVSILDIGSASNNGDAEHLILPTSLDNVVRFDGLGSFTLLNETHVALAGAATLTLSATGCANARESRKACPRIPGDRAGDCSVDTVWKHLPVVMPEEGETPIVNPPPKTSFTSSVDDEDDSTSISADSNSEDGISMEDGDEELKGSSAPKINKYRLLLGVFCTSLAVVAQSAMV